MAEKTGRISGVMWALGIGFVALCILWGLSIMGIIPITYKNVKTPGILNEFLESPREDIRGIKVNEHFLEVGKRPSLQILKGYDESLYLMRPYRQVKLRTRNLTRAEVLDFCTNITGSEFEDLRSKVSSGKGFTEAWRGTVDGDTIRLVKVSMFSYLVIGLSDKPIFISQVELAKRLGMDDASILSRIIPAQKAWYSDFASSLSIDKAYPLTFTIAMPDALTTWLEELQE